MKSGQDGNEVISDIRQGKKVVNSLTSLIYLMGPLLPLMINLPGLYRF